MSNESRSCMSIIACEHGLSMEQVEEIIDDPTVVKMKTASDVEHIKA